MYVKQLELSHFKSFGSTTAIPLLPGFTVVSGPNGSGKSNLLDAMLFALGLSSSKGMRAERLPDLVNHTQLKRGGIAETRVTVTFELPPSADEATAVEMETAVHSLEVPPNSQGTSPADHEGRNNGDRHPETAALQSQREWRVSRKLRVTKQGTYTSTYAINDEPCTLNELHEQLNQRRIYPQGYNIVLQGDVTSIISMNARQRREIIDELAGVANFDRKINQAKEKLDAVKEQEDRFRIVEQELVDQRDRLGRDRIQAEKYQQLRSEFQTKTTWEGVLRWRDLQGQIQAVQQAITTAQQAQAQIEGQITAATAEIEQLTTTLSELNAQVKALGEEEQLALQSTLVSHEAELRQLHRQQEDLNQAQERTTTQIQHLQQQLHTDRQSLDQLSQQQQALAAQSLAELTAQRDHAHAILAGLRQQAQDIAQSADDWVQAQARLHQQIDTILHTLDPQRSEQAQLQERVQQLERQQQLQQQALQQLEQERSTQQTQLAQAQTRLQFQQTEVQTLAEAVATADTEVTTHQQTQARLLREQQEKQRQLDKLEAQEQAQQEAQGTYATRVIRKANLSGVHGLVAQLGQVDPHYQLALEIAAGARLGHLVVDDDGVAAAGIELLKRERAGRATFLPLNKIRSPRGLPPLTAGGAIDYALHLIDFEDRYEAIFAYVLGNTVVFSTLADARRHLGQYRMVTLDGDLLEPTGAMTGGSQSGQHTLHFGGGDGGESATMATLRSRLADIQQLLTPLQHRLDQTQAQQQDASQALVAGRQQYRETQLRVEQLEQELQTLTARHTHALANYQTNTQDCEQARARWQMLQVSLPQQEAQLQELRQTLAALEQSQTHSEWQTIQRQVQAQEGLLNDREQAVRAAQGQVQELGLQQERLRVKLQQGELDLQTNRERHQAQQQQQKEIHQQRQALQAEIARLQADLAQLETTLGTQKLERDRVEVGLRERTTARQQLIWEREKLQTSQQEHQVQLQILEVELETQGAELPEPLPEIPSELSWEQLQEQLRSLQKRMQALEPVNMLAIEEYDRTQTRLEELTAKLETLDQERKELLLRIENFTTLRHQSFREAFDAVNQNFQGIFAELSDGDGYLQLESPEDPFQGGLNLVAHPKGKPVQRLASMSGGEKSLTALSFIFALQRYRPSPFYAFDEVDMFLDGANVERLSNMIQKQAQQAQFIVVSLRRPMIEAADRTIGVTQARGTHTQVIGLQLRSAAP